MENNIAIPMNLDAFTLGLDSCRPDSRILIAPLTQPSYVALRLDSSIIQHDIVNPVDLHLTSPADKNPRVADLGTTPVSYRYNRLGVNLHWTLPRLYRTARAAADGATSSGDNSYPGKDGATKNPAFPRVPNRWLVVRYLKKSDPPGKILNGFKSWVVESDRLRSINEIGPEVDLENDVTPFVSYDGNTPDALMTQAEVFIGNKVDAPGYTEAQNGKYVPLTIMNSSNPLFPDYTPHNANVFSTLDNFAYQDGNSTSYLTKATADYFVLGWHSDGGNDPLSAPGGDLSSRLKDLLLVLNTGTDQNPDQTAIDIGNTFKDGTRVLCHSAVYNVQYDQNTRTQSKAEKSAASFTKDTNIEPISIGSTPLDGIISFLDAHKDDGEAESVFGSGAAQLAKDVVDISALIYDADEGYNSKIKAQDLVWRNNYAAVDGGYVWTYDGRADPGGPPAVPSSTPDPKTGKSDMDRIKSLNEAQSKLDAATRKMKSLQWDLGAEWWKFVSDQSNKANVENAYRTSVKTIKDQIDKLSFLVQGLQSSIDTDSSVIPVKKTAKSPYFIRKDPTLCIAGLDSGWPANYMKPATVRLDRQLNKDARILDSTSAVFSNDKSPVPDDHGLRTTARKLLAEFINFPKIDGKPGTLGSQPWNNSNPFVPLFIEYEMLYYHIDYNKWDIRNRPSPFAHGASHVRFGISSDVPPLFSDAANQKDVRTISGRVIILPQPVFDLAAIVAQVLPKDSIPKDFPLTSQEIENLKNNIQQLNFISAPLIGLTDHLTTRCGGQHVKPNLRGLDGSAVIPLKAAVNATIVREGGTPIFDDNILKTIDSESALTPYGNLMDFGKAQYPGIPFKPVTHGQIMFTKLSIIDKFGQAIALPTPKPRVRKNTGAPPSIYPCLSDSVAPDILANGNLNTIFQEPDVVPSKWPLSRFIELTPSINQDARLNAAFVGPKKNSAGRLTWQETSDYDQPAGPVWGWIVINYADSGLQFFLGDGTFYREVRMGGMTETTTSARWLPFDQDPTPATDASLKNQTQMNALITKFLDPAYLQSFFLMINASIKTMPFPPSSYSAFANAIVGKPLALVNVGWSLELAVPALKAQNTLGNTPGGAEAANLSAYKFPIKLGDADRPFDGVVGYWNASNNPEAGNDTDSVKTDFGTCYSYFVDKETTSFKGIQPSNFPLLSPDFVHPEDVQGSLKEAEARRYTVTTMLVDPYTPLHAYSPILPVTNLSIPEWCIQSGFRKITAFFHLGPSLLSADVPASYVSGTHVTPTSWSQTTAPDAAAPSIRLPIAGKKGMWKWLQPYRVNADGSIAPPGAGGAAGVTTKFNQLDVAEEDSKIRNDPAPYTFVEGYLQLARPLVKGDLPAGL